ncbi:MAG: ArsA family ATPase [Anaerolineae bacterium]
MRSILFTGKGGVGKTTLAAATALSAAKHGHRTLVVSTDPAHSLADSLDQPLSSEPRAIQGDHFWAAEIDTGEELERHWGKARRRIAELLREEGISAAAAGELAVLPGLDEILALLRIKQWLDEGAYDLLVIDSAPTGAATRLLSAPDLVRWYRRHLSGLSRTVLRAVLPALSVLLEAPADALVAQEQVKLVFDGIRALQENLTDPERTSVRLVLLPERMALLETERAYTYMSLFGMSVDALFLNRLLPDQVQDPYFDGWRQDQFRYRREVLDEFRPLPVFEVPLMNREVVGLEALAALADATYGSADPAPRLGTEQPLEIAARDGRYVLSLRVSGVATGAVQIERAGDALRVRLGRYRRTLPLPQYLVGLSPSFARLENGRLVIVFEDA